MGLKLMSQKLWTIELDLEYYGKTTPRLKIGDLGLTTNRYTAGDDKDGPIEFRVIGYEIQAEDEPNKIIGVEYTHRELYKVRNLLTREETACWPEELEVLK